MSGERTSWMRALLPVAMTVVFSAAAFAQTTTLYTVPAAGATGGIAGRVDQDLTHAVAFARDRVSAYRAELSDGGRAFRFSGLPTAKYDLVLVTKAGAIFEGVELGEDASKLPAVASQNAEKAITKADTFFNKAKIHRRGLIENGDKMLLFVERVRDKQILKQSGETLNANLRRLEVLELIKATDDWQFFHTRHLYREEAPVGPGMSFLAHRHVPELGNIRVIASVKDLGSIRLSK